MADEEMIWDEAAGKLVPKSGYKNEAESAKDDTSDRHKRPTRRQGKPAGSSTSGEASLTPANQGAGGEAASTPGGAPKGTTGESGSGTSDAGTDGSPAAKSPAPKSSAPGSSATESPAASSSGNTGVGLRGAPPRVGGGRDEKTTAHGAGDEEDDVAGWLAFLDRSLKGGFSIVHTGQNSIGRGPDNHIVIAGERTVTREAAAFLIVDPVDWTAHLRSGTGRSLVRVNDELITEARTLAPGDRIQIGKVTCMYVPFPWDAVSDDDDDA
jgi:hypothetical protein